MEQIHNQQNNRNKQKHGLTFQIKPLFKMMLDGFKEDEFKQKRRFAGKDDAVDQMLGFVFGRIGGENGKRRQGMRQTASQRTSRFRDIARLSKSKTPLSPQERTLSNGRAGDAV